MENGAKVWTEYTKTSLTNRNTGKETARFAVRLIGLHLDESLPKIRVLAALGAAWRNPLRHALIAQRWVCYAAVLSEQFGACLGRGLVLPER